MAKVIMIQGTASNVGKSLITAGLCRIFKQDGYRTAPFKAQNMALNSCITAEGLEMGRAQVMQCEAAGTDPSVLMNPVLLKPTNDTGSQVIVNGEVIGNMSAKDYFSYKKQLVPIILNAYRTLAAQYDVIVIEGAGSPAEINLKQDDIVNMGMAKMANAPVLLAGDIDRGGVFASLYGTVMLLEEQERRRIKGLIINKFRGDKTILEPGLGMLSQLTDIPVLGVLPRMDVDIDDEDSLTERFYTEPSGRSVLDMAVIKLPRISNFTDFRPFAHIDGLSLRYVSAPARLGSPDCIFLPGTKNTMADLKWLRQTGLEALIKKHAAAGKPVFGVCGGYQMLGQSVSDPHHAEEGGEIRGMELLPVATVFGKQKTRTQISGHFQQVNGIFSNLSHLPFAGYEIHMGQTHRTHSAPPLTVLENKNTDGAQHSNIYGTYIHGIFDDSAVVNAIIQGLLKAKGINDTIKAADTKKYKETQYDLLADTMRQHMDIKQIYKILEGNL